MNQFMPQVVKVIALPDFTVEIHFNNGDRGRVHLPKYLALQGFFAPLAERDLFKQVYVEHGTLCWPNGIDLDPVVIHAWAMGTPIELASAVFV